MNPLKLFNFLKFTFLFNAVILLLPVLADAESKFTVGLILPLSGTAADYGMAIKNSIELARQDEPRHFTNIEFLYEDAAYNTNLAVSSFNKLINFDKVDIIATWGVTFCQALAPIAETKKIPLIGFCIDPKTAASRDHVMRYMNVTDEYMQLTARHLNNQGFKKLAIVVSDNSYLEEMFQALTRNLIPGQTLSIVDRVPVSEMDFRSQIMKIKKGGYDAVGVFVFLGQISTFYKQAKQLGLNLPTFGTNFFETLSEVNAGMGTMKGALFSNIKINEEFAERYKVYFEQDSQLAFGAPAYEFAKAVGELFNNVPRDLWTPEKILVSLSANKGTIGSASGPYFFKNDKSIGKYMSFPITMKEVTENGFRDLPLDR